MIGDPNQLPATIFSKVAESKEYDRSLFQRMQTCGHKVTLLDEQYRMNRYVSKFISDSFYQGKLQDNARIDDIIGNPDLYKNPSMGYLVFLHTSGNEEFENGSYQNMREVDLVVNVCEEIHQSTPSMDISNVGVISPYSRQVYQLREKLKGATKEVSAKVEVNTVDGFQGREKDVIIFSCVRSYTKDDPNHKNKSIGFLDDPRRMNVSLSRARLCLVVVGNIAKLYESKRWRKLIDYSFALGILYDMDGWKGHHGLPAKLDKFKITDIIKYLN
jgi:senataxin